MRRHVEREPMRRSSRPAKAGARIAFRLRPSIVRAAAAIALAMLVLVPLVTSGHTHGRNELQSPCAVCVVAHHAPAASGPSAPDALHASLLVSVAVPAIVPPAKAAERSPDLSRAPPSSLPHPIVA